MKERQFERSVNRFLVGTEPKTYSDFIPMEKHHRNCAQCDVFHYFIYHYPELTLIYL